MFIEGRKNKYFTQSETKVRGLEQYSTNNKNLASKFIIFSHLFQNFFPLKFVFLSQFVFNRPK